jgi:hypothetical protein
MMMMMPYLTEPSDFFLIIITIGVPPKLRSANAVMSLSINFTTFGTQTA